MLESVAGVRTNASDDAAVKPDVAEAASAPAERLVEPRLTDGPLEEDASPLLVPAPDDDSMPGAVAGDAGVDDDDDEADEHDMMDCSVSQPLMLPTLVVACSCGRGSGKAAPTAAPPAAAP